MTVLIAVFGTCGCTLIIGGLVETALEIIIDKSHTLSRRAWGAFMVGVLLMAFALGGWLL